MPDGLTEFDDVAPYLLGCDVGAIVDHHERRRLLDFFDTIEDDARGPRLVARMSILGPPAWRDTHTVIARIRAFRRGLGKR